MKCKKYKIKAYVECIIKSDEENLYQAVEDWLHIDDDCDEYITNFKIVDYDWREVNENED